MARSQFAAKETVERLRGLARTQHAPHSEPAITARRLRRLVGLSYRVRLVYARRTTTSARCTRGEHLAHCKLALIRAYGVACGKPV